MGMLGGLGKGAAASSGGIGVGCYGAFEVGDEVANAAAEVDGDLTGVERGAGCEHRVGNVVDLLEGTPVGRPRTSAHVHGVHQGRFELATALVGKIPMDGGGSDGVGGGTAQRVAGQVVTAEGEVEEGEVEVMMAAGLVAGYGSDGGCSFWLWRLVLRWARGGGSTGSG